MYLKGKENLFPHHDLFASFPVLGNAIAIMPHLEIDLLKSTLDNLESNNLSELVAAVSVLPHNKGVVIKALASKTQSVKSYWDLVLKVLRKLNRQSPLPKVPK